MLKKTQEAMERRESRQMNENGREALVLNGSNLTLDEVREVVYERRPVKIDESRIPLLRGSRQVLFDMAAEGKPVYGLNHGVGWNKDREFGVEFFEQFNRNLIRSHSVGVMPYAEVEEVRAMMLIRLNTALCCRAGISVDILRMYEEFLNRQIHPRAKHRGAEGIGDVNTMSHIGLAIIGDGEVEYHGKIVPAKEAIAAEGLKIPVLGPKDGLSIVSNGSHCAAQTALLAMECEDLLELANVVYCLSLEGLNGGLQPLGVMVNEARGLAGQIRCAADCRRYLAGTYLEEPDPARALQDPLSYRCGAAVNGSVRDALDYMESVLLTEMNHTGDNPCIIYEEHTTSVSPNFEVTTLSLAVDMMAAALCHMSRMVTNRLFRLVDPNFSKLSRFLTPDEVKVIGYSTYQKTICALDAENRWLSNTTSTDFDPVAGDIEDHASNLSLAARRSLRIVDNLRYMIAVELVHACQAVDMRRDSRPDLPLGNVTGPVHQDFRTVVPRLWEDRNLSEEMETAYQYIKSGRLTKVIREADKKTD